MTDIELTYFCDKLCDRNLLALQSLWMSHIKIPCHIPEIQFVHRSG